MLQDGLKEVLEGLALGYLQQGYYLVRGPFGNFAAIHPSKFKKAQKNNEEKIIWERELAAINQLLQLGYFILAEKDSKSKGLGTPIFTFYRKKKVLILNTLPMLKMYQVQLKMIVFRP